MGRAAPLGPVPGTEGEKDENPLESDLRAHGCLPHLPVGIMPLGDNMSEGWVWACLERQLSRNLRCRCCLPGSLNL